MINPIEVRIIEQIAIGAGADAVTGFHEGRMFIARDRIVGRREVLDDPHGVKARLFIRLFDRPNTINVADTLDEIDGVEAPTKPARRVAKPIPQQGA